MSLNDKISAFRGTQRLVESGQPVAETFDPMHADADFPDLVKAGSAFKKASAQADALRDQGEDPGAQKELWGAHKAKKDAQAALLGATLVAFPHLDVADAMHVAGKHIKRGNTPSFVHIAALSDFHGARDHNENGITFNTPYRKTRAEGFVKCLKHHYPDIQIMQRDLPTEGLVLIQLPNGEHLVPQMPEEPQDQMPQQPEAQEAPPEEPVQQEAPPEDQPGAVEQRQPIQSFKHPTGSQVRTRSGNFRPATPWDEPSSVIKPPPPKTYLGKPVPTLPEEVSDAAQMIEAINIRPFKQFGAFKESAESTSWANVKALKEKADRIQELAVRAHLRRDPAKEQLYDAAAAAYTEMQQAQDVHLNKFGGYVGRKAAR